jgi:hypothetical protein
MAVGAKFVAFLDVQTDTPFPFTDFFVAVQAPQTARDRVKTS